MSKYKVPTVIVGEAKEFILKNAEKMTPRQLAMATEIKESTIRDFFNRKGIAYLKIGKGKDGNRIVNKVTKDIEFFNEADYGDRIF